MENNKKHVGALWIKTSKKGTQFLAGKIGTTDVVIFQNGYKDNDVKPDYLVYKSEKKVSSTPLEIKAPTAFPAQTAVGTLNNITEEDIPF